MSRKARNRSSINLYHVIIRGINKQDIFIDNQDKNKFIKELKIAKEKFDFKLYAYVIMPNHVHLVIKEKDADISKIMHRIQLSYSEYLNLKYDRVGHVFQGRFNSKNIEDEEYLRWVIRYIHLNPDKAKIEKYDKYTWSSFNEYIKSEKRAKISNSSNSNNSNNSNNSGNSNNNSNNSKNSNDNNNFVDTVDILKLFNSNQEKAIKLFNEFHQEKSKYLYNEEYSEFEIQTRLDDSTLIKIITDNIGLDSIYDIQRLNAKHRDEVLSKLISIKGTTLSQIARITGISIKIIERARKNRNLNIERTKKVET